MELLSCMRSLCKAAAALAAVAAMVIGSVPSPVQGDPGAQVLALGESTQDDPDEGGQ
ncbi:hypothetical protein GCM10010532_111110 [Dactylosporangium siamense]|uniref:Uncharacterized protein n=1 Tax=Dactylosporangium siamense TaxID=685454 RepID=A0A919Q209_9ACTN|nr:hypothetical protein Dsi01nite_109840 [Dactylosporangium siamense]